MPPLAKKTTGRSAARTSRRAALPGFLPDFLRTGGSGRIGRLLANRRIRRVVAAGLIGTFLFSVFTVPVRAFISQRRDLAQLEREFDSYADANEALQDEVNHLQTPEGVRAAARDQLGYVVPGEKRIRLLPPAALPTDLPAEWPYTIVSGIVDVHRNIAAANNAPLAPLAP